MKINSLAAVTALFASCAVYAGAQDVQWSASPEIYRNTSYLPEGEVTYFKREVSAPGAKIKKVTEHIAPFYMDKAEVSVEEFRRFAESSKKSVPAQPSWSTVRHPIVNITLDDAKNYCRAQGKRLPTESEWEYAARAGKTDYELGATQDEMGEYAWFASTSGWQAHPVQEKRPNAYDLYDIHGNVWEWTEDAVLKGGAWYDTEKIVRSGWNIDVPGSRGTGVGFRCALPVNWHPAPAQKQSADVPAKFPNTSPAGMISIPAGQYKSSCGDVKDRVTVLQDFSIDRYAVTLAQYREFAEKTTRELPEQAFTAPDSPVTNVSWDDANSYCRWAGKRLAAADETGRALAFAEEKKTDFGIYKNSARIWEWTQDWYTASNCRQNAKTDDEKLLKTLRDVSRPESLNYAFPGTASQKYGFRCAKSDKPAATVAEDPQDLKSVLARNLIPPVIDEKELTVRKSSAAIGDPLPRPTGQILLEGETAYISRLLFFNNSGKTRKEQIFMPLQKGEYNQGTNRTFRAVMSENKKYAFVVQHTYIKPGTAIKRNSRFDLYNSETKAVFHKEIKYDYPLDGSPIDVYETPLAVSDNGDFAAVLKNSETNQDETDAKASVVSVWNSSGDEVYALDLPVPADDRFSSSIRDGRYLHLASRKDVTTLVTLDVKEGTAKAVTLRCPSLKLDGGPVIAGEVTSYEIHDGSVTALCSETFRDNDGNEIKLPVIEKLNGQEVRQVNP